MVISDKNQIRVGMWVSQCCIEDLFQVKTQKDIDDLSSAFEIEDNTLSGFDSKEEAAKYLLDPNLK